MNKQDYEKMSDLQINRLIAFKARKMERCEESFSQQNKGTFDNSVIKSKAIVLTLNDNLEFYDFCNNWSDMGPLIEQNQINLNYFDDEEGPHYSCSRGEGGLETDCNFVDHKNPLRASAIVYLLMQEDRK